MLFRSPSSPMKNPIKLLLLPLLIPVSACSVLHDMRVHESELNCNRIAHFDDRKACEQNLKKVNDEFEKSNNSGKEKPLSLKPGAT